jgi:hypothetical protein
VLISLVISLEFRIFAKNYNNMARQIKFQYQVKKVFEDRWEAKELFHPCDPNKSDRENLDDAFCKACDLGADPNKNVRWCFI